MHLHLRTARCREWSLAVALAMAATGCADSGPPVIGVAMGGMAEISILPARQQRFNDSVGARHQVALKLAPVGENVDDPSGLKWASELVATRGLVAVVGHESSRAALQAAPVYAQRGVVQIVPTGTSGNLATVSPWTFPLVASDSAQGKLLADHLLAKQRKRITIYVQDDEYGRGVARALTAGLAGSNAIVLEEVTHTLASDIDLLVRSVLSHVPAPDALVLVTQGPLAATIAELSWKRDSTLMVVGSDATSNEAARLRTLAPSPGQLALATYWVPDTAHAVTKVFLRDYRESKLNGEPGWYHAALYDAVGLLSAAAADAGHSSKDVRDWLQSLGRTRPAYEGVLGSIDFTGAHPISAKLVQPTALGWERIK